MPEPTPSRLAAILRQKCPRCRQGTVFRGAITMNEACPVCGHVFAREPGYFLGAMYFSYALGVPTLGLFLFLAWLQWPDWPLYSLLLVALLGFIPLLPLLFRYSRILWMHFDEIFDPAG